MAIEKAAVEDLTEDLDIEDAVVLDGCLAVGHAGDGRWFVVNLDTSPIMFLDAFTSEGPAADDARLLLPALVFAATLNRLGWDPADAFSDEESPTTDSLYPPPN